MIRAWHFLNGDELRDGTTAPKDGEWLEYSGKLVMCESGLHASIDAFDALLFAPGNTLCLVDCDGRIINASDKLVCSRRRIVARMDAEPLLRYFARQQALSVAHRWDPPQIVLDYLMGDDAGRDAARDAAWAAGRNAGRAAAWAAAWAASRAAAMAAAMAAGRDAARDAFNALVNDAFQDWI
jgi:hypothetical protein